MLDKEQILEAKEKVEDIENHEVTEQEMEEFFASEEFAKMKEQYHYGFDNLYGNSFGSKTKKTFMKSKSRAKNKMAKTARRKNRK